MNPIIKSFEYGHSQVRLETNEIARQAAGSVMASMGDTQVLVTVATHAAAENRGFLPLSVEYEERTYAAGRIPGGFFRREGRPSEKAVLTCRLIDRPVRPLFPKNFYDEVQVVVTVLSVDPQINPDIISMIGASAALRLAKVPFRGPIGACRIGFDGQNFLLNPAQDDLNASLLDLVVAGTQDAVLMVESEAQELSEEQMRQAIAFGHEQMQVVIQAIEELATEAGAEKIHWPDPVRDPELEEKVKQFASDPIQTAYQQTEKVQRQTQLAELNSAVKTEFADYDQDAVADAIKNLEKKTVRSQVLESGARIDGRSSTDIRPISIRTQLLARVHGSSLFTRGETQAIVTATLGTDRDAQIIDALEGEYRDRFMLHYNFPPYSVGEVGRIGVPKRREIGHGRLARRALSAVLPSTTDFPYTIRVVSDITESNGSSSMATVCGGSLALMDAGVPIQAPVAGIAMGLIVDQERYLILSDILGDEDHLGDMDFKVAGTEKGITALQMDIKIAGLDASIMSEALDQAREGRLHILKQMAQAIDKPRENISDFAPRIISIKIPVDRIRDVIGKGGATIRSLSEETGCQIDVEDDGTVQIASTDFNSAQAARKKIELLTADVEIGTSYEGKVVKIMEFGAFVNILPGRDGLLHISQISHERINKVTDKLSEGDMLTVKVLDIDKQGRIRLSMKALTKNEAML